MHMYRDLQVPAKSGQWNTSEARIPKEPKWQKIVDSLWVGTECLLEMVANQTDKKTYRMEINIET